MNAIVNIVMIGWIPALILLFTLLPARRAVVTAAVAAWLFLPVASFPLPGLPDYTKTSATAVGLLLGAVLFDRARMSRLRLRWFDLPILSWCLVPFASSLTNGLGYYDGVSAVLRQTIDFGLPYLIGRAYFGDAEGLRDLAVGILIGGLIYIPLCGFEILMSPQLHRIVYGYHAAPFAQSRRFGGFRPVVFMRHGLEVGMWMTAASMLGYWLWACGTTRKVLGLPLGGLLLGLFGMAVLCRSTGALLLLLLGLALLEAVKRTGSNLLVWTLVLAGPLYAGARTSGLWSGRGAVALAKSAIDESRAASFEFRLGNEDLLIVKALERPFLGWGGWGRNRVLDEDSNDLTVIDGLWIDSLGKYGLIGLIAIDLMFFIPLASFALRYPGPTWKTPRIAPAAGLVVLVGLFQVDCLFNGMVNQVFLIAVAGVTGFANRRAEADRDREPGSRAMGLGSGHVEGLDGAHEGPGPASTIGLFPASDPRGGPAARPDPLLVRSQAHGDQIREVKAAWYLALDEWAVLVAEFPENVDYQRRWLDGHNDLAWFLIEALESSPLAPECVTLRGEAIRLAEAAIRMAPGCQAYWNTLGVAYYRSGDWEAARGALEWAVDLDPEGAGLGLLFLAMSRWGAGDEGAARRWLDRADAWMNEHGPDRGDLPRFRAEAAALIGGQGADHADGGSTRGQVGRS